MELLLERLIELLREFPPEEPSRKRYISEIIGWSSKFGPLERGDAELHHAAGSVYAEGIAFFLISCISTNYPLTIRLSHKTENEPYDAERHLILGTTDSAETLAKLEFEWYTGDGAHTAGIYASRAVIPFLLTGNLRSANKALLIFTSRLSAANPSLASQQVSSTSSDVRIYPSLPLLNFLSLLLIAVQRGSADLFRDLTRHYTPHIKEVGIWDEALATIGEMYFNIKIPRQGNPLLDMMGNMFFGGGQGGGNQRVGPSNRGSTKKVEAAPSSAELD